MRKSYRDVSVARVVYRSRRVTIPQQMGRVAFVEAGSPVVWSRAGNSRHSLLLRRGDDTSSDALLGRTITTVWQVSIPAVLMDQVGIAVEDWVYLRMGSDLRSIRVTGADQGSAGLKDAS